MTESAKYILGGQYLPIFVLALTVSTIYLRQWWQILRTDGADLPHAQLVAGIGIAFFAHALDMAYWGMARLSVDWDAWAFGAFWPIIAVRSLLCVGMFLHFDMWAFATGRRHLVRPAIAGYFALWGAGVMLIYYSGVMLECPG